MILESVYESTIKNSLDSTIRDLENKQAVFNNQIID